MCCANKIPGVRASSLIDLCKSTAIIDEETDRDRMILFNSNTFRDGQYARKALLIQHGSAWIAMICMVGILYKIPGLAHVKLVKPLNYIERLKWRGNCS